MFGALYCLLFKLKTLSHFFPSALYPCFFKKHCARGE